MHDGLVSEYRAEGITSIATHATGLTKRCALSGTRRLAQACGSQVLDEVHS